MAVPQAQAQGGDGEFGADRDAAGTETVEGTLISHPLLQIRRRRLVPAEDGPQVLVAFAQQQFAGVCRSPGADAAATVGEALVRGQRLGGSQEDRFALTPGVCTVPLTIMRRAQPRCLVARALALRDLAAPGEDRVLTGDLDDLVAEQRVETRRGDQSGEDLKSVANGPVRCSAGQQGQSRGHCSSQVRSRAAARTGSWTSVWP